MDRRKWAVFLAVLLVAPAVAEAAAAPDLHFSYRYPPQVRVIPRLRAWFDREGERLRSASLAQAQDDRRAAAKNGAVFNPYESDRTWKVVTDTPRFLSLSLQLYDYTGGAHGNSAFDSLIWDKATSARRTTLSFFTSGPALRAALSPAFCRQLDAERRKKRGGEPGSSMPDFEQCIDPTQETVILGSSDRRRFNRIGILIAPYDAGPYAEGSYEVTLPVTPAILAAVRPEWRRYFAVGAP